MRALPRHLRGSRARAHFPARKRRARSVAARRGHSALGEHTTAVWPTGASRAIIAHTSPPHAPCPAHAAAAPLGNRAAAAPRMAREAQREWYRRNREKVKAKVARWKKTHRERALAIQRKANHQHAQKKAIRGTRHEIPGHVAELELSITDKAGLKRPALLYIDARGALHAEDHRSAEEVIREWESSASRTSRKEKP